MAMAFRPAAPLYRPETSEDLDGKRCGITRGAIRTDLSGCCFRKLYLSIFHLLGAGHAPGNSISTVGRQSAHALTPTD
jgi:hypothetical protein